LPQKPSIAAKVLLKRANLSFRSIIWLSAFLSYFSASKAQRKISAHEVQLYARKCAIKPYTWLSTPDTVF